MESSDVKKYPKLSYPDDEETHGLFAHGTVIIQEKLDGANFRFTYDPEDGFTFGSRNMWGDEMERDQFAEAIEFVRERADEDALRRQHEKHGRLIYFGEAMNPHTISYDWESIPDFLGFDVWSVEDQQFVDTSRMYGLFEYQVGLPTVPEIDVVDAENFDISSFEAPESEYAEGKAEGVVFKNHDTRTYAKFVRDDFKEKHYKKFGKPKKYQKSGAEKLSYQYITRARIEKAVHRLIDEGEWDEMQMEMMCDLPEAVIRDMAKEEAGNAFMEENWEVDLHDFRSTTSSRCAEVLRQMIDKKQQRSNT